MRKAFQTLRSTVGFFSNESFHPHHPSEKPQSMYISSSPDYPKSCEIFNHFHMLECLFCSLGRSFFIGFSAEIRRENLTIIVFCVMAADVLSKYRARRVLGSMLFALFTA